VRIIALRFLQKEGEKKPGAKETGELCGEKKERKGYAFEPRPSPEAR